MRPDKSYNLQAPNQDGDADPKVAHATKQRRAASNPHRDKESPVVERLCWWCWGACTPTRMRVRRSDLKELKIRPSTDEHDYQVRLRSAIKFLIKVRW